MINLKNNQYLNTAEIANRFGISLGYAKMLIQILKVSEQYLGIKSPEGQISIITIMDFEEFRKNENNKAKNKEENEEILP